MLVRVRPPGSEPLAGRGQRMGPRGKGDESPSWDTHPPLSDALAGHQSPMWGPPFLPETVGPWLGSWAGWRPRADPTSRIPRLRALSRWCCGLASSQESGQPPAQAAGRPRVSPRLSLLGIQLLSPAPFYLPGPTTWGWHPGVWSLAITTSACTPEGGAGMGGFSLMVWHPEVETWVTGSHLGRSPAV